MSQGIVEFPMVDITVGDRVRAVDDAVAKMLATAIEQVGLLQPISARRTPNGKTKLSLVIGGHRHRAHQLLGRETVRGLVFEGDADDARMAEVLENLARNDLSVLDRAIHVAEYRTIWERKYGPIKPGNPNLSNRANLAQLAQDGGFAPYVADRMGCSARTIKRLDLIARSLTPDLRLELSSSPLADNQSQLLALAKLDPAKRSKAAEALRDADGDFGRAMGLLEPKTTPSPQQKVLSQLIAGWSKATPVTRRKFLAQAGLRQLEGEDG